MTDPAASSDDYFLEIEGHFAQRRGTPFILSAKDWMLMKKWRDDGVPLPVVIEAIDAVFEKNEASGRRKVISSLSYCKHAVKEIWEDRKQLYVGTSEVAPEADVSAALELLAESLPDAHVAAQIRELAKERSVPRVEERLMELEGELIARMMASLSPADAEALRGEVGRAIGDVSRLDDATRKRTEEANLWRIVRERFGLPRLTLFR